MLNFWLMIKQVTESVLLTGRRKGKEALVFEVLGDLDEASCFLGWVRVITRGEINEILYQVQKDLSRVAAIVAGQQDNLFSERYSWLEETIKKFQSQAPPIKDFVIPGRNELEGRLHLARAVIRRLERHLVALNRKQSLAEEVLNYLNRLSWLLL